MQGTGESALRQWLSCACACACACGSNLRTNPDMIAHVGVVTGLSDHTLGNATAITSTAVGASIIEKHFTLDRSGGGPDDTFSLEPRELEVLCRDACTASESLARIDYGERASEQDNIKFRRSRYFVRALKAGIQSAAMPFVACASITRCHQSTLTRS